MAGDLTINGDREDVILIREADGKRSTTHLNLTESAWLNGPYQNIQPNDVLVVNPNGAKVKSAGYIGNVSVVLAMALPYFNLHCPFNQQLIMEHIPTQNKILEEENFNIKKEVAYYGFFWPWFVVTILIALASAFFYLRYSNTVYESTAQIQIKTDADPASFLIGDLELFGMDQGNRRK